MTDQWGGGSWPPPYQQPYPQQQYGPQGGPPGGPPPGPGAGGMVPPPGQWGPGAPPGMAPPRSVGTLGQWTVGLLACSGAVHVVAGVLLLLDAGAVVSLVLGLSSLLMVAVAVLVMVWLHRVRANIEHLDPYQWAGRRRLSKGWAVGSWFVPVGFLWLPLLVVLDVWWGTAEPTQERRRTPKLITGWWVCWLVSWFTGVRFVHSVSHQNGIRMESHMATVFPGNTALSALFAVGAAVFLALLVRKVTDLQAARVG